MSTIETTPGKKSWLPRLGSPGYYVLLGAIAIFILGPLGGVTASYMCFSLGFFVGGQVLAGILGSTVTYGYGPEGRHGANYMQTMAASVASMAAMGVLIQAMVWLGMPEPPAWQLVLYFLCIGMFGVGVGMLYTPILVDKLQLTYPSGLAVANILRALTDKRLLKRSVAKLGGGMLSGFGVGALVHKVASLGAVSVSGATLGAGMIVGARIGVPAIVVGAIGLAVTPYLRSIGWLGPDDPWRKIGFIIALGTIMGAAFVDLSLIFRSALQRAREKMNAGPAAAPAVEQGEAWKTTNTKKLVLWVVCWGAALVVVANVVLGVPALWVLFAIGLVFLFMIVNGISLGISDSNPISSAFVVSVLIMAAIGLTNAGVGLIAAAILLISTSVGCDMQQDRSTGWRLGTNRVIQFRYQVIGVLMGAVLAVVMAKLFMSAYPVLKIDLFANPETKPEGWQSAMTYKIVGVLRDLTNPSPHTFKALGLGVGIGVFTEVVRKLLRASKAYQAWRVRGPTQKTADFVLDAIIVPSPYASSFGGFVDWWTSFWFGMGGIASSTWNALTSRTGKAKDDDVPEDMSSTSLVGGGLIAGESLWALTLGLIGLGGMLLS